MIDNQPNNCVTLLLRSAFPLEDLETSAIQESPAGQALPCITRRDNPQRHETSRLDEGVERGRAEVSGRVGGDQRRVINFAGCREGGGVASDAARLVGPV